MSGAHEALPEGTLLAGKFRVVRLLGQGGMGAVYEIEHEITKHRRALKLLHKELQQHPTLVERFLREASAAGRIGDAHIVEVFDAGTLATGEPYVVLELLAGETLASMLAREKRLDLVTLVDIAVQACDGVAAAHAAGIVHRDLKPENLFLAQHGTLPRFVKLLDFGVSKFDRELTDGLALTHEGSALGTPLYMPPEQARGQADVDARADVYALGVILYECAAGEPPFLARSLPELSILIHEGRAAPLHERRPDLPRSFTDVVASAMAVDRDQRIPTAKALAKALRALPELPGFADTLPTALGAAGGEPSAAARASRVTPPATSHAKEAPEPSSRQLVVVLGVVFAAIAAGAFAVFEPILTAHPPPPPGPPEPAARAQPSLPAEPRALPSASPGPEPLGSLGGNAAKEPPVSPHRSVMSSPSPSASSKAAKAGLATELPLSP